MKKHCILWREGRRRKVKEGGRRKDEEMREGKCFRIYKKRGRGTNKRYYR
jgi:hypothetical protein